MYSGSPSSVRCLMSERINVCCHIFDLVKDMSLRDETVDEAKCSICDQTLSVGRSIPAEALLQVLSVPEDITN
jgi:hypothetical protein